jgi:hypothetical protein
VCVCVCVCVCIRYNRPQYIPGSGARRATIARIGDPLRTASADMYLGASEVTPSPPPAPPSPERDPRPPSALAAKLSYSVVPAEFVL